MPRLKEVVKVTEVREVQWYGTLEFDHDNEEWGVIHSPNNHKPFESFEDWFEKLKGKHVRVTLEVLSARDESNLLNNAEEE